MSLPIVAICGRPNVGKSTLFNILARRRISIEDPTSGVTRDRIESIVQIDDKHFQLFDTGGIGIVDDQNLGDQIYEQVNLALDKANIIIFLVDIMDGVTPLDKEVAKLLRTIHDKDILFCANKVDNPKLGMEAESFQTLGFGSPLCISAKHRIDTAQLKENLLEKLQKFPPYEVPNVAEMKIAVVGKPNSGKSTIINYLAQEERVIVSEIAGTTRDSVDVRFEKDGKAIIAIDTAGLKRNKNVHGSIDFYSQKRAEKAIRRCDIVLLMVDATKDITRIDKEIANYIREEHKAVIVVVNKWDLVPKNVTTESYGHYITKILPTINYAPISFITAKTGKNVGATIDLSKNLFKQTYHRVSTGELNRVIQEMLARRSPGRNHGQKGKIYYATQIGVAPPTIIIFVNDPSLISKGYRRYVFNFLQSWLNFEEIPIKVEYRERKRAE